MSRTISASTLVLLMTFILFGATPVQAQTCTLNGQPVDLGNGATTAGKTGIVICKKDGQLWRKFEYKNGKQSGYTYIVNYEGAEEFSTNEKGNKQGSEKKYSQKGQLIRSCNYDNGDQVGLLQAFYESGKPKTIAWYEKGSGSPSMEIEYNKDGSLRSVLCGKKSFTDQDRELCGFNGAHSLTLVEDDGRTEKKTYKNGTVSEYTEATKSGQVLTHGEIKDGLEHRKSFFDNGSLQTEAVYKGPLKVSEISYYMNGNRKSEIIYKESPKKSIREVQEFSNSGQLIHKGTEAYFNDDGLGGYKPIGSEEDYFESGKLKESSHYTDAGELTGEQKVYDEKNTLREFSVYEKNILKHRKSYDENGKLKSDRDYFSDGSYKELSH